MELSKLDIKALSLLFQKVYLPLMEQLARKANNNEWLDTLKDFEELMVQIVILVDEQEIVRMANPIKKSAAVPKSFPTSFPSLREEYVFWQGQIVDLTRQQQWMMINWGEATTETDTALRQVHYTLRLFRLVRDPIQVFSEKNRQIDRIDLYVKALAGSLKAVVLQPSAKSGIHSKFPDLVASNTQTLARWMLHILKPQNLLLPQVESVVEALRLWEAQWAESKLGVVSRLTGPEFAAMFLASRTVLDNIHTVQSLIKETRALREMTEQIDDYFARQKLVALIRDDLEYRIDHLEMRLFLVENQEEFAEFVRGQEAAQKSVVSEIQLTLKHVLDAHTSFEGLKLLRKMMDKSLALAGTHSGALDGFLGHHQREQLNQLSTEMRLIRKGFDVTDYINEKESGNVDMAQKLFERRLLYHRVKVNLITIFPHPNDWDETAASSKIKEQYVELAKYLKTTEDKLHNKWFTTVQKRANKAMARPILKKLPDSGRFVTTLQDTMMTIWDETRLFLQTRFQVPHVCHILLMQKPDLIHHNRSLIAILERLSSVVEKLTPFEFLVLNSCYSSVEDGLNLGTTHVTWPSLCLAGYIAELMESVERFQAMAEDVALITTVLDRRIDTIMDFQLLRDKDGQQPLDPSSSTFSAAQFFKKLSLSGDEFFIEIRRIVSELPPILLQVESIVCNSQTGSAPELQNYYDYWREKIYAAIVRSVQARFEELSYLLENGPPQFVIQLSLRDGRVVIEPDLESIERDISGIVHHWIERSCVVPDWQEGSCNAQPLGQRSLHDRLSREPLLQVTVERDQRHCKRLVAKLKNIIDRWTDCTELWSVNKVGACEKLRRTSPSLLQYDEQLRHYKNYWTERIENIDGYVITSCVILQMRQLRFSAVEHIREWIRQLGATWLASTKEKLVKADHLIKARRVDQDGSTDIDIEMLLIEIQESWHRLIHYGIKVPVDVRMKLKALHCQFNRQIR